MVLLDKFKVPIFVLEDPSEKPTEEPELKVPPAKTTPPPEAATGIALAAPSKSVPAATVVVPPYVFAPERVKVPEPFF